MSDILVTPDNVGRFAKRLQKALGSVGKKTTLAESAELFAQALGCASHHELMKNLKSDDNRLPKTHVGPDNSFEHDWFFRTEKNIQNYFAKNKDSMIESVYWAVFYGEACLNFSFYEDENKDSTHGFGFYFQDESDKENKSSWWQRENKGFVMTESDRAFCDTLDQEFSRPMKEKVLLDFYLKDTKGCVENQCILIAEQGNVSRGLSIFSEGVYPESSFVSVPSAFFLENTISLNPSRRYGEAVFPDHFKKWRGASDAMLSKQKTGDLIVLAMPDRQKKDQSLFPYLFQKTDENWMMRSADGNVSRVFLSPDDIVSFEGQLAAHFKLRPDINPYFLNTKEHGLWREGFLLQREQKSTPRVLI